MEMISPDTYIKEIEKLTTEQLLEEKSKLEKEIEKIEEEISNNVPDYFFGSRETKLSVYGLYLSKLNELIANK